MFKVKLGFDKLTFNLARYRKESMKAVEDEVREGVRKFLREAILKIPVYSGMAMGTLLPLGRLVGEAINISPTDAALKKHPGMTPEAGAEHTKVEIVNDGKKVTVKIQIDLLHFLINEFYGAPAEMANIKSHVPWQAMEAGRKAYREHMRAHLMNYVPKVKSFITRTRVEIK